MPRLEQSEEERGEKQGNGLLGLAKQLTEEELTQRRKAAVNPIPYST
jgi:hypothetical protein